MCVNLVSSHIQGGIEEKRGLVTAKEGGRLELRCARVCSWEQERLRDELHWRRFRQSADGSPGRER